LGWKQLNGSCSSSSTDNAWKFSSPEDNWRMSFEGVRNTYNGGGYIIQFERDLASSENIINELEQNLWIDRQTRAVFLEFTLYNPNLNLFFNGIYLAEFPESAGVVTWVNLQVFRPFQTLGAIGTYALLCYFIYMIFFIISTCLLIFRIYKEGWRFLKNSWNIVDLLCSFLAILGIVFWSLRYAYANEALDRYYDNKLDFIQFQHIAFWDNAFAVVMGILVFIATIRILQILGYNRRMTQLIAVISGASKDLSGFAIVFGIIYFAYVMAGYLLFGKISTSYRSLFVAFGSLTNSIIGKNHLDILRGSGGVSFGELYYFTYIVIVILVLISMFAVILNISITVVKQEVQGEESIYGLTNVIADSVKDIVGIFAKSGNKNKSTASEPGTY
jgi:polycystin 1L2